GRASPGCPDAPAAPAPRSASSSAPPSRRRFPDLAHEAIPDTADRLDVVADRPQLLPQALHVRIHRARGDIGAAAPLDSEARARRRIAPMRSMSSRTLNGLTT